MSGQNSRVKREPTLAFVIPCYNEEAALHVTAGALKTKIRQLEDSHAIAKDSIVIFVDDGSSDETWNVIEGLHRMIPLCSTALSSPTIGDIRMLCSPA